MAKRGSPESRELLQDALLESNLEKLPEKIARAEVAVYRRIEHMKANPGTKSEQDALNDALTSLSVLKKRHLPGWNRDI
jgi:hypothetical protein